MIDYAVNKRKIPSLIINKITYISSSGFDCHPESSPMKSTTLNKNQNVSRTQINIKVERLHLSKRLSGKILEDQISFIMSVKES